MAEELWKDLSVHMQPGVKLTFVGHSMGGSLAVLLTSMARLRLGLQASNLRCFTFGAPPVLSLITSFGCSDILEVRTCCLIGMLSVWVRWGSGEQSPARPMNAK